MSAVAIDARARAVAPERALPQLARLEIRRYARHPLFLLGVAGTVLMSASGPQAEMSVMDHPIAPAALIGILGLIITASLTRSSETVRAAAGVVPLTERTRTTALAAACLLPFAVGVVWWVWAVLTYQSSPTPANGYPFGPVSDTWVAVLLFGQGPIACLGGPLLGILVGRWLPGRGAPAVVAVGVVASSVVAQGGVLALLRVRLALPWTNWGGPIGIEGDEGRMVLLPGSVYWWVVYVACLCALGLIASLLHDRERPRRGLVTVAAAIGAIALVAVVLAMVTGVPDTLINPLPSS